MQRIREKKRKRKKNRLNGAQSVLIAEPISPFTAEKKGHLYVRNFISTFADIYLGLYYCETEHVVSDAGI